MIVCLCVRLIVCLLVCLLLRVCSFLIVCKLGGFFVSSWFVCSLVFVFGLLVCVLVFVVASLCACLVVLFHRVFFVRLRVCSVGWLFDYVFAGLSVACLGAFFNYSLHSC